MCLGRRCFYAGCGNAGSKQEQYMTVTRHQFVKEAVRIKTIAHYFKSYIFHFHVGFRLHIVPLATNCPVQRQTRPITNTSH